MKPSPLDALRQDLRALDGEIRRNRAVARRHYVVLVELEGQLKALRLARRVLRGAALQFGLPPALAGLRRPPSVRRGRGRRAD